MARRGTPLRAVEGLGLENMVKCSQMVFGCTAKARKLVDIMQSLHGELLLSDPHPCPLMRKDTLLVIKHIDHLRSCPDDDHSKFGLSDLELEDMSNALFRMLLPANTLLDAEGKLMQDVYRVSSPCDNLKNRMRLRTGPRDGGWDVHFVGSQSKPHTLYAQAMYPFNSGARFCGLSVSLTSLNLRGGMKLAKTFTDGMQPDAQYLRTVKELHPNHIIELVRCWMIPQGSTLDTSQWIVDNDGPNHATIASKEDIPLIDYEFDEYAKATKYVEIPKFVEDLPWTRHNDTHVVLVPILVTSPGGLPAATEDIIKSIVCNGDYEDILKVMILQEQFIKHEAAPSERSLLEVLELTHETILDFRNSDTFEWEFEDELWKGLMSLAPLINKVNLRLRQRCADLILSKLSGQRRTERPRSIRERCIAKTAHSSIPLHLSDV